MGWPQKEYLTRRGVARRRAYPSIFIRRRLHGYISRNVTITNAGTPSAVETSSCFWGSGAARALRGANPRATSASFRPTPLPVSDIPATTSEKQNAQGNTFPAYASRVFRSLDSFWPGHSAVTATLSTIGKTFRPIDKPWIRNLRETRAIRLRARTFFFFFPFVPIDVHIFLSSKIYEKIFQYRQRSNGEEKTNTRYIRIQYSILVRRQCGKRERERERAGVESKWNKLTVVFLTTGDTSLWPIHNRALHPETGTTIVISGMYERVGGYYSHVHTCHRSDGDK